jgi:hypothetical protein
MFSDTFPYHGGSISELKDIIGETREASFEMKLWKKVTDEAKDLIL